MCTPVRYESRAVYVSKFTIIMYYEDQGGDEKKKLRRVGKKEKIGKEKRPTNEDEWNCRCSPKAE